MPESNSPRISIVMPSLNTVNYIERAIRSVVNQKYPELELIIKDGGSVDGTLEIIKFYAIKYPKIIKWTSKKDKGQADAINKGMKDSSGDIIGYLNSDDVYKEGALKIVADYFKRHPEKMWAYGKCDIINGDDKKIRTWITSYKNFWLRNYSYTTLLILNYISQMGVFWRREAWRNVGNLDIKQHYVMDYDYWLKLGRKYNAGVINKYLGSFRIVPATKSSTGFVSQFQDEFQVSKKYTDNVLILNLHSLHYKLIILIYTVIRLLNRIKEYAIR